MGAVSEGKGVLSFELGADGSGGKHLYQDEYVMMNGREVLNLPFVNLVILVFAF